jgi:hypothetical protein
VKLDDELEQIKVVAGARNWLDLLLSADIDLLLDSGL